MSYPVYLITLTSLPRDHHALFIPTSPEQGQVYHVTGNIQAGMTYESTPRRDPEEHDATFSSKTLLGKTAAADLERVDEVCREIEVLGKQFDRAKRLVAKGKERRCQEWASEAIELLKMRGVIVPVVDSWR